MIPFAQGAERAIDIEVAPAGDLLYLDQSAGAVERIQWTGNSSNHAPTAAVQADALAGKPVGIVAMGATPHHYLGVDWHLREVLTWFGAIVAPTSVYLVSADFVEGQPSDNAKRELESLVQALCKLRTIAPAAGEYLGPRPLASRRG